MIARIAIVAILSAIAYMSIGFAIALTVAMFWNPLKGAYDSTAHILAWPLTVVLLVWSLIRDGFNSICGRLNNFAMRKQGPRTRKSIAQKVKVR